MGDIHLLNEQWADLPNFYLGLLSSENFVVLLLYLAIKLDFHKQVKLLLSCLQLYYYRLLRKYDVISVDLKGLMLLVKSDCI